MPVFVLAWVIPAWIMLALASLLIVLVPFRRIAQLLGRSVGNVAFLPLVDKAAMARAERLHTVIAVAARYAPFRSNCFPQAIVAAALCCLYRVPYAVHFGCALETSGAQRKMKAHAWVVSGPAAICGGNRSFVQFGVVGCFARTQRTQRVAS